MKKRNIIIIVLSILLATLIIFLLLKTNNKDKNIKLNEVTWVTPKETYIIDNSDDKFKINNDVEIPNDAPMSSWAQQIDYTIIVDDKEYSGSFVFDSSTGISKISDNNPTYDVDLSNYKNNSIEVKIVKK